MSRGTPHRLRLGRLRRTALRELYVPTENPNSVWGGKTRVTPTSSSTGFLLIDSSQKPLYANAEAIRILTFPADPRETKPSETFLAEKVRSMFFRAGQLPESDSFTEFMSGKRRYLCRAIYLHAHPGDSLQPNAALLLERKAPRRVDVSRVAELYGLTPREQETVEWLMHGLTSKEIANRMQISRHTVSTFLRLVMGKMGVSTRAAIVGTILEHATRLPG